VPGQDVLAKSSTIDVGAETAELMSCIEQLKRAMVSAGIDDDSPLGAWGRAQQLVLLTFSRLIEGQTVRIEQRANAVAAAAVKSIDEMRAATAACRAQVTLSQEQRRSERLTLASEVAEDIKKVLKESLVIREVKWNRRQNWTAAALAAAVLMGCFIAGGIWTGYYNDRAALDRCISKQVIDSSGRAYCGIDVVRGG
jgi:hypothetical protein